LVILAISIENGSYAGEPVTIGRFEVKFCLSKQRAAVDA